MRRMTRQAMRSANPSPYGRAKPGTSVWNTATIGMPSRSPAADAHAPMMNGLARWSTSGWCRRSAASMRRVGNAMRTSA
jgi:hypothetical protein